MKQLITSALFSISLVCFLACGGGGDAHSCKEVCAEQTAAGCQPFASIEQCNALCEGYEGLSSSCLNAGEVYWECQLEQADICDPQACQDEGMAFTLACSNQ